MSGQSPLQMVDLLPLAQPEAPSPWLWGAVLASVLLVILTLWWWRRTRDPLRRLLTGLKNDSLSPRDVAHQLAKLSLLTQAQQAQLDRLRFSRQAPDRQQIEQFLRSVRDAS